MLYHNCGDSNILGLFQATAVCVCVCTCVCRVHARVFLNPLSNSQNKHERSQRKGEMDCVEVSLANFMLYSCQYQTVLKTAVFPLTFPTSCYQLAPYNMSCLFLHWLFGFHSGQVYCVLSLLFPVRGPSQKQLWFINLSSP